jgi:hypothetical protein
MVKRVLLSPGVAAPIAFCWASTWAVGAFAQEAQPAERAQSFEAAQGSTKEDVPGGPLLVAGYGILWVAMLVYLFRLVRLQQRAQNDLARLEQALARDPGSK